MFVLYASSCLSPVSYSFLPYNPLNGSPPYTFRPFRLIPIIRVFGVFECLNNPEQFEHFDLFDLFEVLALPTHCNALKSISLNLQKCPTGSKCLTRLKCLECLKCSECMECLKGFEVFGVTGSYNTLKEFIYSYAVHIDHKTI